MVLNTVTNDYNYVYGRTYCSADFYTPITGDDNNGTFWTLARCENYFSSGVGYSNFIFVESITLYDLYRNNQTFPVRFYLQGQQCNQSCLFAVLMYSLQIVVSLIFWSITEMQHNMEDIFSIVLLPPI